MNEEELKKEIVEIFKKYKSVEDIGTRLIMLGFQKGKLEQKKEDIKIIDNFFNPMIAKLKEVKGTENITNNEIDLMIKWREQLSKEIGGGEK